MSAGDRLETPPNRRPAGGTAEAPPVCWPLLSAQEMRELDRHAIEVLGVPSLTLMENAGRAIAEEILREGPIGTGVSIVCGRGNNGGDGLVAARHLHRRGVDVLVCLDVSRSMLARDQAPSRLSAARREIRDLAQRNGLSVVYEEPVELRRQAGKTLGGVLFVLRG